jgi:1-aminocyclopropane-1-carboxylate deaminase/D-cysteine desulfhydrase-like pyridoxal-dependent ACC family enzyme
MLPRYPLLAGPTPLHRLPRAGGDLGLDLWIKRDDLTGFAGGGNKVRKLELILGWILEQGATAVVGSGSLQSNFVRQLAGACAVACIRCEAVVMDLPFDGPAGKPSAPPLGRGGNEALTRLFGAGIRLIPDGTWEDLEEAAQERGRELAAEGERAIVLPVGGSMPIGAWGFVEAARELDQDFDVILHASSSGSTQAGLAWALAESGAHVVGIACDPEPDFPEHLSQLAAGLDSISGESRGLAASDFEFRLDWVGPGYGVASEAGRAAAAWLARREAILLDPVYTAKAFAGLIDLARAGEISGRVCFWHTGGWPSIFAHPKGINE